MLKELSVSRAAKAAFCPMTSADLTALASGETAATASLWLENHVIMLYTALCYLGR